MLEVQGVGKRVVSPEGPLDILVDISFTVQAGESLAILGASGAGKSTLLGILAGLDEPTHGGVWIGDQPLHQLDEDGRAAVRRTQVGFVFQSFNLILSLTALENVMVPLELQGVAQARQRSEELLYRVGLERRLHHTPNHLSGGEQQRVAIARAFAASPRLLFADEPTGNLDSATGQKIIDLLFALNRDQGATLVLVTHDVELAARCGRRLQIEQGRMLPFAAEEQN